MISQLSNSQAVFSGRGEVGASGSCKVGLQGKQQAVLRIVGRRGCCKMCMLEICGSFILFVIPCADLSGARSTWLEGYKSHEYVTRKFSEGFLIHAFIIHPWQLSVDCLMLIDCFDFCEQLLWCIRGKGHSALVANLNQNPRARAVVGAKVPTLMKTGMMWFLLNPSQFKKEDERYMLPKDSLVACCVALLCCAGHSCESGSLQISKGLYTGSCKLWHTHNTHTRAHKHIRIYIHTSFVIHRIAFKTKTDTHTQIYV